MLVFLIFAFIFVELNVPNSGHSIPKFMAYHYHYHYYYINRELNVPSSGFSIPDKHNSIKYYKMVKNTKFINLWLY